MWWKSDGGPIEWVRLIAVHDRVRRKILCGKKQTGVISPEFPAGIEGKCFRHRKEGGHTFFPVRRA